MRKLSIRVCKEATDGRLVWQIPTKINLHFDDLRAAHRDDLGVSKTVSARTTRLIGDEHLLTVLHQMDELKTFGRFAIGPAACKVGSTVKAVVERAAEVKVVGNQRLNRRAVF